MESNMTSLKNEQYSKALVELNVIINNLSEENKEKIPKIYRENVLKNMDKNYTFDLDPQKSLLEQNYMTETKALYVSLYKKYLSSENEKEKWKKYDNIVRNINEEEKNKKFNSENIFNVKSSNIENNLNSEVSENKNLVVVEKKNIFQKIFEKIKNFIKLKNL